LLRAMPSWKPFRHRLEGLGAELLAAFIPRLSPRAAVRLAHTLAALAYRLDQRGRSVALANLECAFRDGYSAAERHEIVRGSYRNFLQTMVDLFWMKRGWAERGAETVHIEGFEVLRDRLARERRGAVFLCVHQGNWERASMAGQLVGLENTVVTDSFKNQRLAAVFKELREVSGQKMIPQENAVLRLLKIAKRGGTTGMLVDLTLPPSQAATVIDAFGMKMCVPLLHCVLAQRANALLVPSETIPQPDGTCRVIAHPGLEIGEGETLPELAQRCWDMMEPMIRARPADYLWAYKHFRYKPKKAPVPYPFYAHESGKFEKLLLRMS
jgi:Kdo2-lipid IVA lauroyltransferase/acyltransferase